MVRRALLIAVSATLILAMSGLLARAVDLQPGLWQVSSKRERDGAVTQRPTRTQCITPEQVKTIGSRAAPPTEFSIRGRTCKIIDLHRTDKEVTWRMECSGLFPAEQTVRHVVDSPKHYTSELKTAVKLPKSTISSTLTSEGRWIGECPK